MSNFIKRIAIFFILIGILVGAVMPTFAQQENPPVIVLPEGTPSLEVAAEGIIAVVYTAISLPFLAPLVTFLVAISKRAAFLKRFSSEALNFTYSAILFGAWVFALKLGFGEQFKLGVTAITPILTTLGTLALGVTANSIAASQVYKQAKAQGVAVIGYSRPLTMEAVARAAFKAPEPDLSGDLHA